jgi:hypothetical protein
MTNGTSSLVNQITMAFPQRYLSCHVVLERLVVGDDDELLNSHS